MAVQGIETYTELAKRMGITKNQLSAILSESYNPIKSNVLVLSNILGVDPEEIMESHIHEEMNHDVINENKENIDKGSPVTAIELFAGAGGLALGLEEAGIHTLEFVEIEKVCCDTLKHNRPNWNVVCEDITNIDFTKYEGKVDLVTGGFPCQAFSYAGKKLGFEDVRGTLFYEFARCVKETDPLMFMAENVRGLVSHDKGRTLSTILNVFEGLGYDVQYKVLNASYYGVGQKRERIVIIGSKKGENIKFDYPIPEDRQTTLREALKDCPDSPGTKYSEKKKNVMKLVPPGGCWVDLPEEVAKEYMGKSYYSGGGRRGMARRISWDEPCLTLTCSPIQKQTERCHPEETRPFKIREYARIQSFPDFWEFQGGISDQYKQIGNAVP
ncbi:MAG: DNA (cytosine-5-)-methyltransferase, partial [Enterococcus sp.]|nr:DNA (cytosine-5-)-methyltransferase [Enterococcus sp.]